MGRLTDSIITWATGLIIHLIIYYCLINVMPSQNFRSRMEMELGMSVLWWISGVGGLTRFTLQQYMHYDSLNFQKLQRIGVGLVDYRGQIREVSLYCI